MKKIIQSFIISIAITSNLLPAPCTISHNTALFRPFSSYSSRELISTENAISFIDSTIKHQVSFSTHIEYAHSFHSNMGALPFWSGSNEMTIGNNNGLANLDAYQFGLGNVITDENGIAGKIKLCPVVQHAGADMILTYTHYKDDPSFFFTVHMPLGALIVSPHLTELVVAKPDDKLKTTQTTANPASSTINFINANYPPVDSRYKTISHAFFGGLNNTHDIDGNITKTIRLRKGQIAPKSVTEIRLSDLSVSFGYNFIVHEDGFFGAAFKATFPTGTVPTCQFVLEPIFGRAGSWGVGAEFMGHYTFWSKEKNNQSLQCCARAEFLHLIPGRTPNFRSFDLRLNGPGSKYLLIQHYPANYTIDTTGSPNPNYGQARVPSTLQPAINLTTLPVISKINLEATASTLLQYKYKNWIFSAGAEIWGRTKEHLRFDMTSIIELHVPNLNNFAVIGRQVGNYSLDGQANTSNLTPLCEPKATINKSQDPVQLVGSVPTVTTPTTLPDGIADARIASNRIPQDVYEAIDICSGQAPSVVTAKLLGAIGHTWTHVHHLPSINLFGGVEFANNNSVASLWTVGVSTNFQF